MLHTDTAIHEAGHTLACHQLNIQTYGYCAGRDEQGVYFGIEHARVDDPAHRRYISAAGAAAEIVLCGKIVSSARQLVGDLESASWAGWADFKATAREVSEWFAPGEVFEEMLIAQVELEEARCVS